MCRTLLRMVSLVLIVMLVITGCSNKKPLDENAQSQNKNPKAAKQTSTKQSKIKVYYSDAELTGLIEKVETISYQSDKEKYKATLDTLKKAPDQNMISLWGKVTFKTISFQNGDLVIDIDLPDEARLGSPGEQFALEALKKTLFQFTEVHSIDLLVDGNSVDSLMGHVELEHPMKRQSS